MGQWGFAPQGIFLDHNMLVPIGLWVRKMNDSTRIKGAFGDYGLLYQSSIKFESLALNNCNFLNTNPIFINKMHFVPFLTLYRPIISIFK